MTNLRKLSCNIIYYLPHNLFKKQKKEENIVLKTFSGNNTRTIKKTTATTRKLIHKVQMYTKADVERHLSKVILSECSAFHEEV